MKVYDDAAGDRIKINLLPLLLMLLVGDALLLLLDYIG